LRKVKANKEGSRRFPEFRWAAKTELCGSAKPDAFYTCEIQIPNANQAEAANVTFQAGTATFPLGLRYLLEPIILQFPESAQATLRRPDFPITPVLDNMLSQGLFLIPGL
jgi:hypothetical protein